jgi:hypothetical protein
MCRSTRPGAKPICSNPARLLARVLVILFVAGLFQARSQTQADPEVSCQASSMLTNADVLEMNAAGLGAEVILAKIKASSCDFNTTSADLKKLKSAGISDDVIVAMIGATAPASSSPRRAPTLRQRHRQIQRGKVIFYGRGRVADARKQRLSPVRQ